MLLIYLIYGLSFFVMAVAMSFQYFSSIRILPKRPLLLLIGYALLHSFIEFEYAFQLLEMNGVAGYSSRFRDLCTVALMPISFMLLFGFGIELLINQRILKRFYRVTYILLPVILLLATLSPLISSRHITWDFKLDLFAHYFIIFPSALMAAYAFWRMSDGWSKYAQSNLARALKISASIFLIYGVITGLFMGGATPYPNWPGALVWPWIIVLRSIVALALTVSLSYAFFVELSRVDLIRRRMRDEYSSVMAHDIQNLLGTISMSSDHLISESTLARLDDFSRRLIVIINSNSKLLRSLVSQLFDLSMMEQQRFSLTLKRENLCALIAQICDRMIPALKGRSLNLAVPQKDIFAIVDSERIEQILLNLLSNAGKYAFPKSQVIVELQDTNVTATIRVISYGPMIPKDEQRHLFDKYFRSTQSRRHIDVSGAGLGLFIVKELVEAHGGVISVDSDDDGRTCFAFDLPLTDNGAPNVLSKTV